MHKNHLERRGFRANEKTLEKYTSPAVKATVIGRRARKEWTCEAEDCNLPHIEWDEVYVVLSIGLPQIPGNSHPYHMACALRKELIEQVDVDSTNQRRQAIMMARAKRQAG